jgi:CHAT domain-containing protein
VNSRPWVLRAVSGNSQSKDLPLPESRNEVESIAALMPRPPMILLGHAATKEHFRQLPLGEYRVLHLALHGVVAAFIQAGARSVVSTLWELDDHASNKLMKSFYSQLGANSEADALRQAKLHLLRAGLSPYYWASYEIVGDSQRPLLQTK